MRSRRAKRGSLIKVQSEVNMTPLMDLTFMLLILFVITVPILDYKTDVVPPSMNTESTVPEEDPEAVQVTLDAEGNCGVNGVPASFASLEEQLRQLKSLGRTRVRIRASGERPYEEIIMLIRPAKRCGMEVQLETKAE